MHLVLLVQVRLLPKKGSDCETDNYLDYFILLQM